MSLVGEPPRQHWLCWRNKCGHRELASGSESMPKVDRPRVKTVEELHLRHLPAEVYEAITARYDFAPDTLPRAGVLWSASYKRVAWPLASPRSRWAKHGYVLRTWDPKDPRPKTLNYGLSTEARLGWFKPLGSDGLTIVVEDCISALKLCEAGHMGVSLQGTRLTQSDTMELDTYAHPPILLALDQDATSRAISYTKRLGILCLPLQRDIKNQTHEQLAKTIERARKLIARSSP
jgi:hypothetical protein